jgi:hypothetical protein
MWNKVRTLAVSVFALAWWGILYPELCFTEDTFEQVVTVEEGQEMSEQEIYQHLLAASGDEIVIKSRFLEWFEEKLAGNGRE